MAYVKMQLTKDEAREMWDKYVDSVWDNNWYFSYYKHSFRAWGYIDTEKYHVEIYNDECYRTGFTYSTDRPLTLRCFNVDPHMVTWWIRETI